jgi:hypothetical protein
MDERQIGFPLTLGAYSSQLNLRTQSVILRYPERYESVPPDHDPAMAFPQLVRARSGQRKPAPFCKVRLPRRCIADISLTTVTSLQQTENLRLG